MRFIFLLILASIHLMALSQEVIYYDDFTTNKGLKTDCRDCFSTYNYGYLEFGRKNKKSIIEAVEHESIAYLNLNKYINYSNDFQLEATMKFENGNDNQQNGIIWGTSSEKQFRFGFSGKGRFLLLKWEKNSWVMLTNWTESSNIKLNDYNKITIRKVSNEYYFFINEFLVHKCPFEPLLGVDNYLFTPNNSSVKVSNINIVYLNKLEKPNVYKENTQKEIVNYTKGISDKCEYNFNEILPGFQLITSEEEWQTYSPLKACCCYPEFDEKNKKLGLLYNYKAYERVKIFLNNKKNHSAICSRSKWEEIFSKLKSNADSFSELKLNFYPGYYDETWYTPKDYHAAYWVDQNTMVSFSNDAYAEPMLDENIINDGESKRQSLIALSIRVTNASSSSCDFNKWHKDNINIRGTGNQIKFITKLSDWNLYSPTQPCCCFINFDLNNDSYGFLYNYQAYELLKNDPSLASQGYRVATEIDWKNMLECVEKNGDYNVLYNCEGSNYSGLNLVPNGSFNNGIWTQPEGNLCTYWTTKSAIESAIEFDCSSKKDFKISNTSKNLSAYMIRFIKLNIANLEEELKEKVIEKGAVYETSLFGTQEWHCENISFTEGITLVSSQAEWDKLSPIKPCCCYINFDEGNKSYGLLYNSKAFKSISNNTKLKNNGFRVAVKEDWDKLFRNAKKDYFVERLYNCDGLSKKGFNLKNSGYFDQEVWYKPENGQTNFWISDYDVYGFQCDSKGEILPDEIDPDLLRERTEKSAFHIRIIKF